MIKAVIFDLDGVISDTNRLHASVEADLLKEIGINITPDELTEKYAGLSDKDFFKKIFEDYGISKDVNTVFKEKWLRMMVDNISSIPGAIRLISDLKEKGLKLGVASSAPIKFIETVLSKLEIREKFEVITSAEEVEHGKPNPDIFLLAAKRLNIKPQECVVIEDAEGGMIGAKGAKMKCIGLVKEKDRKYPADLITTNLENLSIEEITNL